MKHLTLLIFLIILSTSCKKEKAVGLTSDVPNDYYTNIEIHYNETWNTTTVYAYFNDLSDPDEAYHQTALKLPSGSYVKVNGVELTWQTQFYQHEFTGKQDISIEFKDHSEAIYHYTVIPPDTAYFIGLPDTIPSTQDIQLQVNAPLLDSNERDRICLDDADGDDNNCIYFGTDTLIDLSSQYLDNDKTHFFFLVRSKTLKNANFPNPHLQFGGGNVNYEYIVTRPVFSK